MHTLSMKNIFHQNCFILLCCQLVKLFYAPFILSYNYEILHEGVFLQRTNLIKALFVNYRLH